MTRLRYLVTVKILSSAMDTSTLWAVVGHSSQRMFGTINILLDLTGIRNDKKKTVFLMHAHDPG